MMHTPRRICVFSENDIHTFREILKAKLLKETSVVSVEPVKSPERALTAALHYIRPSGKGGKLPAELSTMMHGPLSATFL